MMACCVNPVRGKNKIGSIGLPLPDVEVRIVDAETGVEDKPAGEVGELIMHSPQHMLAIGTTLSRRWRHFDVVTDDGKGGCTPATWPTSTRTAMCSSSIARRTC